MVTIGNFDGVHLGHQSLLREAVSRGRQEGMASLALTFWPHPLKVLAPQKPVVLLCSLEEKMDLIERTGVDQFYCADFDLPFSQQSPDTFVRSFLIEKIGCRQAIVGDNFAFGKGRQGTAKDLVELGTRHGFSVHVQKPVEVEGMRVNSSSIRSLLMEGKVAAAARLLGRHYRIQGEVIEGEGRGTALGFPTANFRPPSGFVLPQPGIYAAWASRPHSKPVPAAAYIGLRPTFGAGELWVESYLLEPPGSLYGAVLSIAFVEYIRPDEKFESEGALARQIALDVQKVREILAAARPGPAPP